MIEVYVPHGGPESGPVDDSAHGVLQVEIHKDDGGISEVSSRRVGTE